MTIPALIAVATDQFGADASDRDDICGAASDRRARGKETGEQIGFRRRDDDACRRRRRRRRLLVAIFFFFFSSPYFIVAYCLPKQLRLSP